jgi:hypothetical protein
MPSFSPEEQRLSYQVRALSCKDPALLPLLDQLAHLIFAFALCCTHRVFGHQVVGDLDVEVALVFIVGLVHKDAAYLLSLLHRQNFSEVEDSLFPVSVFGVWPCGEANGLVACSEVDVKPGDQSMYEVVSSDIKGEGR